MAVVLVVTIGLSLTLAKGEVFPIVFTNPSPDTPTLLNLYVEHYYAIWIPCAVDEYSWPVQLSWRRMDGFPLPRTAATTMRDRQLMLEFAASHGRVIAGDYECVANNTRHSVTSGKVRIIETGVRLAIQSSTEYVSLGHYALIPCYKPGEIQLNHVFIPSYYEADPFFIWYTEDCFNTTYTGGQCRSRDFNRTIAVTEKGLLYIPNIGNLDVRQRFYLRCLVGIPTLGQRGAMSGTHTVKLEVKNATEPKPTTTMLLYSTPNLTVIEGHSLKLSCIFYHPLHVDHNVSWSKVGGNLPSRRQCLWNCFRIDFEQIGAHDGGIYQCSYPGMNPVFISVTIERYAVPWDATLKDTYVLIGKDALFSCRVDDGLKVNFTWIVDERRILPMPGGSFRITSKTNFSSELSIENARLEDTGTISCEASNSRGSVRRMARLIIYKPGNLTVTQEPIETLLRQPPSLIFNCELHLDDRATDIRVTFSLSRRADPIDSNTNDKRFGIRAPAVFSSSENMWSLRLYYEPDIHDNYAGHCTCHVVYKILNLESEGQSSTVIQFATKEDILSVEETESWWIVIVVSCLFVVVLAFAIVAVHVLTKTTASIKPEEIGPTEYDENLSSSFSESIHRDFELTSNENEELLETTDADEVNKEQAETEDFDRPSVVGDGGTWNRHF